MVDKPSAKSPPGNFTIIRDGQRYELVGSDVAESGKTFFIWRARCYDCGKHFETTTGMTFGPSINRRCQNCKAPLKPVTGSRRRGKRYRKPFELLEPKAS